MALHYRKNNYVSRETFIIKYKFTRGEKTGIKIKGIRNTNIKSRKLLPGINLKFTKT